MFETGCIELLAVVGYDEIVVGEDSIKFYIGRWESTYDSKLEFAAQELEGIELNAKQNSEIKIIWTEE